MLYPLYTNKQINIPYLLKIGDGKVKKSANISPIKILPMPLFSGARESSAFWPTVFIPGWRKTALKRFMNRTCVLSILKK